MREISIKIKIPQSIEIYKILTYFKLRLRFLKYYFFQGFKSAIFDIGTKRKSTMFILLLLAFLLFWGAKIEITVFILIFFSFAFYGWDPRIVFAGGVAIPLLSVFMMASNRAAAAEQAAAFIYYFLLITSFLLIIEMKKRQKVKTMKLISLFRWFKDATRITGKTFLNQGIRGYSPSFIRNTNFFINSHNRWQRALWGNMLVNIVFLIIAAALVFGTSEISEMQAVVRLSLMAMLIVAFNLLYGTKNEFFKKNK